jgi:hypothetical protein
MSEALAGLAKASSGWPRFGVGKYIPSDEEKEIFKRAAERRKDAGIRLKRFAISVDASQAQALGILFDSWISRWGKEKAIDYFIVIMGRIEARLRDKENAEVQAKP